MTLNFKVDGKSKESSNSFKFSATRRHREGPGVAEGRLANSQPDVAGGHIDSSWFAHCDPVRMMGVGNQDRQWPHVQEGVQIPLPDGRLMHDLKTEFYQRVEGQPVGPITAAWEKEVFKWAKRLKERFFGRTDRITGLNGLRIARELF